MMSSRKKQYSRPPCPFSPMFCALYIEMKNTLYPALIVATVSFALVLATLGLLSGCSQKRGIECFVCGKTAVYTPGATVEGLLYVCPEGHETRSNRLVR